MTPEQARIVALRAALASKDAEIERLREALKWYDGTAALLGKEPPHDP